MEKFTEIMKLSQAQKLFMQDGYQVAREKIFLGRLTFDKIEGYSRINGYVVFYSFVGDKVVFVKAFRNAKMSPRTPAIIPKSLIKSEKEYIKGCRFKAVGKTEWAYLSINGNDCQIVFVK